MGRKNDRLFLAHLPDQGSHFVFLVGIESISWLVEDQHRGIVNDRLRKAGAMTKSFRQRLDALVQNGTEKTHLDYAFDRARFLRSAKTAQLSGEVQKPAHRHVAVGRRIFREVTDEAFHCDRVLLDLESADYDIAFGWWNETGEHPHRGGFAGPIRAEKPEHLATLHVE